MPLVDTVQKIWRGSGVLTRCSAITLTHQMDTHASDSNLCAALKSSLSPQAKQRVGECMRPIAREISDLRRSRYARGKASGLCFPVAIAPSDLGALACFDPYWSNVICP